MRRTFLLAAGAAFCSMAVVFILKTLADTMFLAEYGSAYVPHFFAAQSLTLAVTAAGYSRMIKTGPLLHLDLTIVVLLAATAMLAPLAIDLGGPAVFAVALLLVALSELAFMAVWNAATAVARGRAQRSFLPRASAAATAGAIFGGFAASAISATVGVTWLGLAATLFLIAIAVAAALARGRNDRWAR
ncbi:MAG: hypothetical protein AAGC55_19935, partial [Myxococcota bacterium]